MGDRKKKAGQSISAQDLSERKERHENYIERRFV